MAMVFASTLRSLQILGTSKQQVLRGSGQETFAQDLQAIASAKAEEFEQCLCFDGKHRAQSLFEVFQSSKTKLEHPKIHTALKHLLMQTAVVPLTEGNKMKMRHQSFSVTLYFGALKLFLTTNFADTYCPIVMKLFEEKSQIGESSVDMSVESQ